MAKNIGWPKDLYGDFKSKNTKALDEYHTNYGRDNYFRKIKNKI